MTVQITRLTMMARLVPTTSAIRLKRSAPTNATNCTMRITAVSVAMGRPSSSWPNCEASAMTVWMPSL